MTVRYLDKALAEYQAVALWFDDHAVEAGDEFVAAVERAEAMVCDLPEAWPQWPGARAGVRRYLVPGFQYALAYEIRGDEIVILAVAHQRRRPFYWSERTDSR